MSETNGEIVEIAEGSPALASILIEWSKDIKLAASLLTSSEARFLVDYYYQIQQYRINTAAQVRATEGEEPNAVIQFLQGQVQTLEGRIKTALDAYTNTHPAGKWCKGVHGIGPVLAAGLVCHIDIAKAPTVGHIWRFAGLDPTLPRAQKGEKRHYNAELKKLCWKVSDSFVKQSTNEKCFYGKIYRDRKAYEMFNNEAGKLASQAAAALENKKFRDNDTKKCYESGKLPPGHIDMRARRYAVKAFLSGLHTVWYFLEYQKLPPLPYAIAFLDGHVHEVFPDNMDAIPGLREAKEAKAA